LEKTLGNFIASLMQSSPQSAARLEIFRTETLVALVPTEPKEKDTEHATGGGAEKEMDDILEGGLGLSPGLEAMVVEDLPSMNSRAGLYVYLNSLVSLSGSWGVFADYT
jgi:mediator of RNA polymerase II transcription subunit 5